MTVNELRKALATLPADAIVDIRYEDTLLSMHRDPKTQTSRLESVEHIDAGPNGHWVTLVAERTYS